LGVCSVAIRSAAALRIFLRYCARLSFAMDRLKQRSAGLVYRCGKGHAHDGEPLA